MKTFLAITLAAAVGAGSATDEPKAPDLSPLTWIGKPSASFALIFGPPTNRHAHEDGGRVYVWDMDKTNDNDCFIVMVTDPSYDIVSIKGQEDDVCQKYTSRGLRLRPEFLR